MRSEELNEYLNLKREIKAQRRRLAQLRNRERGTVGDSVKDYRTGKGLPLKIEGIEEVYYQGEAYPVDVLSDLLELTIEKQLQELTEKKLNIERWIQSCPDSRTRELLRCKFLDDMSWEQVGRACYMNPDAARHKVKNFLKKIKDNRQ